MKRLGNFYENLISFENLYLAANLACRGKKNKSDVARFCFSLENEIIGIQKSIVEGSYCPKPYRQFEIREPKVRQIFCSDFSDRVVHHAICNMLGPIFEARLIHNTYACRVGKGSHRALKKCQMFARRSNYYLKCDFRKYFESIDHQKLKNNLNRIIKDKKFLEFVFKIIDHQIPTAKVGKGLPIGNLTSQFFANYYLAAFDRTMETFKGVTGYLRYMDDFICFADSKETLKELLKFIREFSLKSLGLELKEKVTTIAPVTEGVAFLGFRIFPRIIRIQRTNLNRLRKKVRLLENLYCGGKINQHELCQSVGSMVSHVRWSNSNKIRQEIFKVSSNFG
jgi:RNA-directed DNA polymerase